LGCSVVVVIVRALSGAAVGGSSQRRRRASARAGYRAARGRPRLAIVSSPDAVVYADRWPAWGHRKIAALLRADGHDAPDSTVLRALRRSGRVLPVDHQAERRQLAEARRAAFVVPPSGPNQVWQLDFTEVETGQGGVWRIAGCSDYWSKLELGWHVSTTQNHRDAIEAVELAIAESERLLGQPLQEALLDEKTGETRPIALVSDNGPCFKAARFASYIERRPELIHIRTRRKSPNQNGIRERSASRSRPTGSSSTRSGPTRHSTCAAPNDIHLEARENAQTTKQPEPKPCHFLKQNTRMVDSAPSAGRYCGKS
jgi:transposase InsO family protein